MMNRGIGVAVFSLVCMTTSMMVLAAEADINEKIIYEFRDDPTDFYWYRLNDTVMGGRSSSGLTMAGDDVIAFYGDVSLENNGGFASVRSRAFNYGIDDYDGIRLLVRGDGKTYKLRLQTSNSSSMSYEHSFETQDGEWTEVALRFEDFDLVYFGRLVSDQRPLNPENIRTFGFMITDKQTGAFRLEIDRISAFKLNYNLPASTRI